MYYLENLLRMKKTLALITFLGMISLDVSAQFGPGGGGGFGGFGGGGTDRKKQASIPGTADESGPRGSGKISGFVLDSAATKAVEFASVALINKATGKVVDGATVDDKGKFALNRVANGTYKLTISFMGFRNKTIDDIKIDKTNLVVDLGIVKMSSDVKQLDEVTVTSQRALIEDKVDRLVYNVEKDISNSGTTASEVLRKVPMVTVDLDGNVSVRGSSSVRVLINGKPSAIMASNVADALKQIPADMIKSVEVITSPSAKYDAEGSAGILNIITKKNTLQGITGNTNLSFGTVSSNVGAGLNIKSKKWGLSTQLGYHFIYNDSEGFSTQTSKLVSQNQNSVFTGSNNGGFGRGSITFDYEFNPKTTLTLGLTNGRRGFNNKRDEDFTTTLNGNALPSTSRFIDIRNQGMTWDMNVDLTKKLKKQDEEISFLALYSLSDGDNSNNFNVLTGRGGSLVQSVLNPSLTKNTETTFQIDYQNPITKTQMFEIGVKTILRNAKSDFQFLSRRNDNEDYVSDPLRSNNFTYNQDVAAGYATYTYNRKKWTVKGGVRYEHTFVDADYVTLKNVFSTNYGQFIPSVSVSKTIKGGATLKWAYNQRLQRPQIAFLNPNVNSADPRSLSFGNPKLDAEISHNIEMSLNKFFGANLLNLSMFGRLTNDEIKSVQGTVDDIVNSPTIDASLREALRPFVGRQVIYTTYQNVATTRTLGMNIFTSLRPTNKLMFNVSFNPMYMILENPSINARQDGIQWSAFTMAQAQFGKGWSGQFFGFFNSQRLQLQGREGAFQMYSFSVNKEFTNKKGSIGLGIDNPFARGFERITTAETPQFSTVNSAIILNRGFRINFRYQFGKMSFGDMGGKRKKSVNNDDLKQEDSGQGGGQGGGGAMPSGGRGRGGR
jgi:ferric enterobactin receptor